MPTESNPLATLDASADFAERVLSSAVPVALDGWKRVVRTYRRVKAPLIAALCPTSGRREYPFIWEPSPTERAANWRHTLERIAHGASGWEHVGDTALEPLAPCASWFAHHALTCESLALGSVQRDSRLLRLPGVRKQQSIPRALAAYLRAERYSDNAASAIAGRAAELAHGNATKGTLVLSANIADLLFCSESCNYSSCHSLTGCHRAGPQQYLADAHTIVAYHHEQRRQWKGATLPHKLYRRIVHIDTAHNSALLMRNYGDTMPTEFHQQLRRVVAQLLCRLAGQDDSDPKWVHATGKDGSDHITQDRPRLAYIDAQACDHVQLVGGDEHRAEITLATVVPCPGCDDTLDDAGALVCEDCAGGRTVCDDCDERISDDDVCSTDDGVTLCEHCYSQRFTSCCHCGENELSREDCYSDGNGNDYCDDCRAEHITTCTHCERDVSTDDVACVPGDGSDAEEHTLCSRCVRQHTTTCDRCDGRYHDDDEYSARGETLCPACGSARLDTLYAALTRSPRWTRSDVFGRASMRAHWCVSVHGSTDHYSALPLTTTLEVNHAS